MKTYHVDGGSHIEPPEYKFHDAYFSVVDDDNEEVFVDQNLGDVSNNKAEYLAIKWVVDNIKERPIRIFSDSQTAIAWVTKGGKGQDGYSKPLDLRKVHLMHLSNNFADQYNAKYISPKASKEFYVKRHFETIGPFTSSKLRWKLKRKNIQKV